MPDPSGMTLGRGGHVFVSVVHDLDRSFGLSGEKRRVTGDHVRVLLLPAESTSGRRLDHPHLLGRETKQPLERLVHVVGHCIGRKRGFPSLRPAHDVVPMYACPDAALVLALDHEVGRATPPSMSPCSMWNDLKMLSHPAASVTAGLRPFEHRVVVSYGR